MGSVVDTVEGVAPGNSRVDLPASAAEGSEARGAGGKKACGASCAVREWWFVVQDSGVYGTWRGGVWRALVLPVLLGAEGAVMCVVAWGAHCSTGAGGGGSA